MRNLKSCSNFSTRQSEVNAVLDYWDVQNIVFRDN